jgi:4-amino-4-deoxy-L-arabinose transferase-like glycosyltransferase
MLAMAMAITLIVHMVTLPRPLNYLHAWGVAGTIVETRAFHSEGILHLRGVPVIQNPPLGLHPEGYVHWPPLLSLVTTAWTAAFGESETAIHAYTLTLHVITTAVLFWMFAVLLGRLEACIATLAWLGLPVVAQYSHVILNETLALPFLGVAIVAFWKIQWSTGSRTRWLAVGAGSIAGVVLSTWELALVPIGLWLGAWWSGNHAGRRAALVYLYTALATAVAILTWYTIVYPSTALEMLHALLYRMGLENAARNTIAVFQLSSGERIRLEADHLQQLIRWVGLVPLCIMGVTLVEERSSSKTPPPLLTVFCGLCLPALLWFAALPNHFAIHEFEAILLAPAVVLAITWFTKAALHYLAAGARPRVRFWAFAIVVPVILLVPLLQHAHGSIRVHRSANHILPELRPNPELMIADDFVNLGLAIYARTPEGSVVVTPELNSVPMYYSRRPTYNQFSTEEELRNVLPQVQKDFPGVPVYFALFAKDRNRFPLTLASNSPAPSPDSFVIVRIL